MWCVCCVLSAQRASRGMQALPGLCVSYLYNAVRRLMTSCKGMSLQPDQLPPRHLPDFIANSRESFFFYKWYNCSSFCADNASSMTPAATSCHACGTSAGKLLLCGRCRNVWFCNRECQVVARQELGHRGANCRPRPEFSRAPPQLRRNRPRQQTQQDCAGAMMF